MFLESCQCVSPSIKSKEFHLPGKKELLKSDVGHEVIIVDASESPIERPQKNRKNITLERKKQNPAR